MLSSKTLQKRLGISSPVDRSIPSSLIVITTHHFLEKDVQTACALYVCFNFTVSFLISRLFVRSFIVCELERLIISDIGKPNMMDKKDNNNFWIVPLACEGRRSSQIGQL